MNPRTLGAITKLTDKMFTIVLQGLSSEHIRQSLDTLCEFLQVLLHAEKVAGLAELQNCRDAVSNLREVLCSTGWRRNFFRALVSYQLTLWELMAANKKSNPCPVVTPEEPDKLTLAELNVEIKKQELALLTAQTERLRAETQAICYGKTSTQTR